MPSLVALRCFEAAARLESFSRAADELHLTAVLKRQRGWRASAALPMSCT